MTVQTDTPGSISPSPAPPPGSTRAEAGPGKAPQPKLHRWLIGFILVAVIAGIVGLTGVSNLRKIDAEDTRLYEENMVPTGIVGKVAIAFQRIRVNIYQAQSESNNAAVIKDCQAKIVAYDKIVDDGLAAYKPLLSSEQEKENYTSLETELTKYEGVRERIFELLIERKVNEAQKIAGTEGKV
jgi:methyl-accepting chemotaxis protein